IPISYWLEPTDVSVLLSWYFHGINPHETPNQLAKALANTHAIPTNSFLGIKPCSDA
ncbi:hypothetical protein GKR29_14040, partial [Staphylococcus aureus]|nr:hypothetical protein [Staphylococcus aureus]